MKSKSKEKIKQAVRESYGKVARAGGVTIGTNPAASCCNPSETSTETARGESCGCVLPGVSAKQMSALMGYSREDIISVIEGANTGLGCGNPVALASLQPGETVVDLGSGGGFDCFLAAKKVGQTGKVIGMDMTPDMVGKARENAEKMGMSNVEFRLGEIENLPVADNSADIIMSNCVINLSTDKLSVYREAFRVLKPGGRLAISDILATTTLPEEVQQDLALVAACVGGAATIEDTEKLLKEAGFQDIQIKPNDESRELIRQWNPAKSENAADYVVSAYIEAVKPS
ncbi:MAG: arsenite methyltransferase [Deltaproteobacteria bacterium]|nr:MAG: arsenite methyltransferase [Deltaproteobacteria bacterium]